MSDRKGRRRNVFLTQQSPHIYRRDEKEPSAGGKGLAFPVPVRRAHVHFVCLSKGGERQRITPLELGEEGVRPMSPAETWHDFVSVLQTPLTEVVRMATDQCGSVDEQDDGS